MNESVTKILDSLGQGDASRAEELVPLVYEELRKLAAARMAREMPGHTLQATALVHEAYLRLAGAERQQNWKSRGHFFGAAAEAMRRILVERARQKKAVKYGGGLERVNLENVDVALKAGDAQILAIDEALARLAERDPQSAQLIKLRFFAGMTNADAARALGLAERTANRLWTYARAWLYRELADERDGVSNPV
jgi:RNA polymerase sigma factor (TIGR02999 family)